MLILTTAIKVKSGLGSVNSDGDWSLLGHSVLEIFFTATLDVNEASEGGANVVSLEAARPVLNVMKTNTH